MGFAEDLDAILDATPDDAPDGALLGDDAAAHRCRSPSGTCSNPARVTIAREKTRGRQAAARPAGRLHRRRGRRRRPRSSASSTSRTRRRRSSSAARGSRWTSSTETLNAHGYRAEALHGGMEQRQRDRVMKRVPRRQGRPARRHRRRRARPRHRARSRTSSTTTCRRRPRPTCTASAAPGRAGREGMAITLAEPREHRLLRSIEAADEAEDRGRAAPDGGRPARAAARDRRAPSLRERLVAGDLDDVRVVVESLAERVRHARHRGRRREAGARGRGRRRRRSRDPGRGAAAVARKRRPQRPLKPARGRVPRERGSRAADGTDRGCSSAPAGGPASAPAIWSGRSPARPASSRGSIGAIEIADGFSLVEVPEALADNVIEALRATKIRGSKVTVRRERG